MDFYPVDSSRWDDFEKLFTSRGAPHYCWCTAWRPLPKTAKLPVRKPAKKEFLKNYVTQDIPIGLLAYHQSKPIGWCSIAPRESYRKLGGSPEIHNVWSLVCFYIAKPYRKQGISQHFIQAAIKYAREQGAAYIESFPVDPGSPSYRFMGLVPMFEKANFKYICDAGSRRKVMLYKI